MTKLILHLEITAEASKVAEFFATNFYDSVPKLPVSYCF